jgi:putative ABC transport system permease protein
VDPGFDAEGLVTLSMALSSGRFDTGDQEADAAAFRAYRQEILDAVEALPQVEAVHTVSSPPFFDWRGNNWVVPEGWHDPDNPPIAERRLVSAGYLSFLRIPILEGRDLEPPDYDDGAEPVVVVSRGLAELAWPGESALGKRMDHWIQGARVVGVAGDIRDEQLDTSTELAYYAPDAPFGAGGALVMRVGGDTGQAIAAIRERIWSVDPDIPITRVATTEELMAGRLSEQRYRARLMTVFAGLAGLFALLGIYGVTSRSVARRTQEMGLRVALGADRGQVHGLVTVEAVRLAVFGVVLGVVVSLAVGGVLERFLWGVTHTDPVTLALVGLGLPLLAAVAALPPARRATKVDPLVALKAE